MSLDKAIEHGKEQRKRWWDARQYDRWCCNHGLDTWFVNLVLQGRKRRGNLKSSLKLKEGLKEYFEGI